MKRKFGAPALLLAAVLVMGCLMIRAVDGVEAPPLTKKNLSEEEYLQAVTEIMTDYKADRQATLNRLAELDTELVCPPQVSWCRNASSTSIWTKPAAYTLSVYGLRRQGEDLYRLIWTVTCEAREARPGYLDCVSLEWDAWVAEHYGGMGDQVFSTMQKPGVGVMLFNLQDVSMKRGDSSSGMICVTAKEAGKLYFGAKLTHTYTWDTDQDQVYYELIPSTEADMSLHIDGCHTYRVKINRGTDFWQQWAEQCITLETGKEAAAWS